MKASTYVGYKQSETLSLRILEESQLSNFSFLPPNQFLLKIMGCFSFLSKKFKATDAHFEEPAQPQLYSKSGDFDRVSPLLPINIY